MSILSKNNVQNNTPLFKEFIKQASFFLKEKIKTARLALTDVTPAELLTEEATNGNPWAPDTRTLASISRSAFELDDYTRIVEILHKRLLKFEKKNWRLCYNSVIVLEHLLTHGPESVSEDFQGNKHVIEEMTTFQHIDEKGFNWGLAVRKKSERILRLLEKGPLLKEERDRARKLSRGIQGFGSFSQRPSSTQGILRETAMETYGRCHSQFNSHENLENQTSYPEEEGFFIMSEDSSNAKNGNVKLGSSKKIESESSLGGFGDGQVAGKVETSFKENMAPEEEELDRLNCIGESNPLLAGNSTESKIGSLEEDDHPFNDAKKNQTTASLLSVS